MEDGGWRMGSERCRMEDGIRRVEDGGWGRLRLDGLRMGGWMKR